MRRDSESVVRAAGDDELRGQWLQPCIPYPADREGKTSFEMVGSMLILQSCWFADETGPLPPAMSCLLELERFAGGI